MGMFGSKRSVAYETAGLDRPNLGGQVLNQIGMNLLGVDFEGQRVREAIARKQQEFMNGLQAKLGPPQYEQSAPVQVQTPDLTSPGAAAPDPGAGYKVPQRTSGGLNINSPELAGLQFEAMRRGVNLTPIIETLKAQRPVPRTALNTSHGPREYDANTGAYRHLEDFPDRPPAASIDSVTANILEKVTKDIPLSAGEKKIFTRWANGTPAKGSGGGSGGGSSGLPAGFKLD